MKGYQLDWDKVNEVFDTGFSAEMIVAIIKTLPGGSYISVATAEKEERDNEDDKWKIVFVTNEGDDKEALKNEPVPERFEEKLRVTSRILTLGVFRRDNTFYY